MNLSVTRERLWSFNELSALTTFPRNHATCSVQLVPIRAFDPVMVAKKLFEEPYFTRNIWFIHLMAPYSYQNASGWTHQVYAAGVFQNAVLVAIRRHTRSAGYSNDECPGI